ncbi:MAG: trypsin-like peptidase domain-containing protein [Planctomycetaceae bacterium]|jgi:serine protease Do|nr:trypsin-like peptidase domain-containing protein [Planctomycetaceae bacterium]
MNLSNNNNCNNKVIEPFFLELRKLNYSQFNLRLALSAYLSERSERSESRLLRFRIAGIISTIHRRNFILLTLFLIFSAFLFCTICISSTFAEDESADNKNLETKKEIIRANELSVAFRNAANCVLPATVKIISRIQTTDEFKAMSKLLPAIPTNRRRRNPGDNTGTGVLIDPRGIVVTNNHVVNVSREIDVELPDGRIFFARKFRHDPDTDVAVIWLDVEPNEKLPYATFGDSDKMDICDWVIAVGNPFELDSTVSAGIISAKGRSLQRVSRTEFLQTDAAINPGNSGGPLINLNGEVIGINTAIASRTGGSQGIGFAVPSNNVKWVVDQLVRKDRVDRAWFGIVLTPMNQDEANRLGVRMKAGVIIDKVLPGSPSEEAGLLPDDVIIKFDGQPVKEVYQFQRLSERAEINREHTIDFIRERKFKRVNVSAMLLPKDQKRLHFIDDVKLPSYFDSQLSILLIEPSEVMIKRLKMNGKQGLITITAIPEGRAHKAGLLDGMLITSVDNIPTKTIKQYIAAREGSSLSDGITLNVIEPQGAERTIIIKLATPDSR